MSSKSNEEILKKDYFLRSEYTVVEYMKGLSPNSFVDCDENLRIGTSERDQKNYMVTVSGFTLVEVATPSRDGS